MRLSLGPGPLPRLVAPGVPDWIGTDGERVGWLVRDRLFLHDGDSVRVVELPDEADGAVATPTRWTIALGSGFVRICPREARVEELLVDDEAVPVATRPGRDVGLFVEVPEHRLLRLTDGLPLPLPTGALHARHVQPWATGAGALWVDDELLYRSGGRVSAIGRAPGAEALTAGPDGAALVRLAGRALVAAPGRLAVPVDLPVECESARFTPDGREVLVAVEDGAVRLDCTTGDVLQRWSGALSPVGFGPGPLLWDLDSGVVRGESVVLAGFRGASPALAGTLLAGPGGDAWRLDSGAPLGLDLQGVCATDGTRVVSADDEEVRLFDGRVTRFRHALCDGDDLLDGAVLEGDTVTLRTLDGELAQFHLDGTPISRVRRPRRTLVARPGPEGWTLPAEDGESVLLVGERRYPLPVDGGADTGRRWAWSRDGALYELE